MNTVILSKMLLQKGTKAQYQDIITYFSEKENCFYNIFTNKDIHPFLIARRESLWYNRVKVTKKDVWRQRWKKRP